MEKKHRVSDHPKKHHKHCHKNERFLNIAKEHDHLKPKKQLKTATGSKREASHSHSEQQYRVTKSYLKEDEYSSRENGRVVERKHERTSDKVRPFQENGRILEINQTKKEGRHLSRESKPDSSQAPRNRSDGNHSSVENGTDIRRKNRRPERKPDTHTEKAVSRDSCEVGEKRYRISDENRFSLENGTDIRNNNRKPNRKNASRTKKAVSEESYEVEEEKRYNRVFDENRFSLENGTDIRNNNIKPDRKNASRTKKAVSEESYEVEEEKRCRISNENRFSPENCTNIRKNNRRPNRKHDSHTKKTVSEGSYKVEEKRYRISDENPSSSENETVFRKNNRRTESSHTKKAVSVESYEAEETCHRNSDAKHSSLENDRADIKNRRPDRKQASHTKRAVIKESYDVLKKSHRDHYDENCSSLENERTDNRHQKRRPDKNYDNTMRKDIAESIKVNLQKRPENNREHGRTDEKKPSRRQDDERNHKGKSIHEESVELSVKKGRSDEGRSSREGVKRKQNRKQEEKEHGVRRKGNEGSTVDDKRSNSSVRENHLRADKRKLDRKQEEVKSNRQKDEDMEESYEELSRKKRKIESELHALDLEEAAEAEKRKKAERKDLSQSRRRKGMPDIKQEPLSDESPNRPSHSQSKPANRPIKNAVRDEKKLPKSEDLGKQEAKPSKDDKAKPNFEVSGKLAEDTNTYNGVVIKYNEPKEARKPKRRWRLYPFKGDTDLPFIPIHRQSAYLFGRTRSIADIPIDHPSCSKQHAVLQYRLIPYKRDDGSTGRRVRPYIIDLESSNGTFVNNKRIDPRCYVELIEKDIIKFGFSSREYVILHEELEDEGLESSEEKDV